jgi:hypothetical protein
MSSCCCDEVAAKSAAVFHGTAAPITLRKERN